MNVLHNAGFIETGPGCDGPRYTRGQPSRETPGVLLNEVTDKYVVEFNVPFRNAFRSIKDLKKNWNLLDEKQKSAIIDIIGPLANTGKTEEIVSIDDMKGPLSTQSNLVPNESRAFSINDNVGETVLPVYGLIIIIAFISFFIGLIIGRLSAH